MTDRNPADLSVLAETITGLRDLADFLATHPGIPVASCGWTILAFTRHDDAPDDTDGFAEVDRIADLLSVPANDDTATGGHYTATRTFGRITYEFVHITARSRALHAAHMSYAANVTPHDDTPEAA
jgi:hypothetical protein